MKAISQANIVAANITASIQNKPLSLYKGSTEIIVITVGKVSVAQRSFVVCLLIDG